MKFTSTGGDFASAFAWATAEVRKARKDNDWVFVIKTKRKKDGRVKRIFIVKNILRGL